MESRISNFSREELKNYIETHSDIKEFYNFLGLRLAGGNYRTINKYIKLYGLENEYAAFKKRVLAEGHKKNKSDGSAKCRTI